MTVRELIRKAAKMLDRSGIEDAKQEAEALFLFAFRMSRAHFLAILDGDADEDSAVRFLALTDRRAAREPLQHITGRAPFYGRDFIVDRHVLIPRFDTEILVEEVLKDRSGQETVLDLCTGSGCIAVTLKKECPELTVFASDISAEALEVAKQNAVLHQAEITFFQSDLLDAVTGSFDVLVSNPPYIRSAVIGTLEPEVRDHDPYLALDGGADGLSFYRRIARDAKAHLKGASKSPCIYLEIGDEQAASVSKILEKEGYTSIQVIPDLTGRPRVVKACSED